MAKSTSARSLPASLLAAALLAVVLGASPLGAQTTATCNGVPATIVGTDDDDIITGTPGDDVIVGLAGNDRINAGGGDDLICGEQGRDRIDGGTGDDIIFGGQRRDRIKGGAGNDSIHGGVAKDALRGGHGRDRIFGDAGDDVIIAGSGNDFAKGSSGDDVLLGGRGFDILNGGPGTDNCKDGPRILQCERTLTVGIRENSTLADIASLTPAHFTAPTGIAVDFVEIDDELLDIQIQGGDSTYDVVFTDPNQATQFGDAGSFQDVTPLLVEDTEYDVGDIIPSVLSALTVGDELYALPFYGESSFLMYNQEVVDEADIIVPNAPTWDEIDAIARAVDSPDVAGMCMRGKPGSGDLGATLTTVVNTFGGTWWDANRDGTPGEARINDVDGGFREAAEFYVNLVTDVGIANPEVASYNECINAFQDGDVAMWYDATSAAPLLEAPDNPIQANVGYALAPVRDTGASGWMWTWALAIPKGANDVDEAWEFMSWATSKDYVQLAGTEIGWNDIPVGTRLSTYEIPEYLAVAPYASSVLEAIETAPIDNPGTTPRPGLGGIQYVAIPEFAEVANLCTAEISEVIGGDQTLDDALDACQLIAAEVTVE